MTEHNAEIPPVNCVSKKFQIRMTRWSYLRFAIPNTLIMPIRNNYIAEYMIISMTNVNEPNALA